VTDDEAFLRAVVAAPGDEVPRLVYADWLDERGDPRGAYLRAEVAWAKADRSRAPAVNRFAQPLDPVWVARVSRPPIGVCCDAVEFSRVEPSPDESDLAEAERELAVSFPPELTALLLNWHGGRPSPAFFRQNIDVTAYVEDFDLLHRTDQGRRHWSIVANVNDLRRGGMPHDLVTFATVGPKSSRFLTVSVGTDDWGCIDYFAFIWDPFESVPRERIARSIGQFMFMLTHEPSTAA
jgi:uncharacterized protein (TIGR02996 family)